jgi:hypothetical protein
MSWVYVSLKLKDGINVITYGSSNIRYYERFNEIKQMLLNGKSPCIYHKINEYKGCKLRIIKGNSKTVAEEWEL